MTASPALPALASREPASPLVAVLWTGFVLVCLFYAVLAADYFISFAAGREALWLRLMAAVVGEDYAFGAGSVHRQQHAAYSAGLPFMLMHTTLAAIAMALGPFQFMRGLRARRPALHRAMGKIYLLAELFSMSGGLIYLGITGLYGVYTGAPFALGLWGLNAMVLWTGWEAYRAIRRGEVAQHRAWLAYNFGLLLTAPGLRILWVLYGLALPGWSQADTNLAITTYLLPLCAMVGLLWLSAEQWPAAAAERAVPPRWLAPFARGLGLLGVLLLMDQFLLRWSDPTGPFGSQAAATVLAHETAAIARWRALFMLYLAAMLAVCVLGPALLANAQRLRQRLTVYLHCSAAAALSGMAIGTVLGTTAAGGLSMPSFWWGMGLLWCVCLGLTWLARRRGAWALVQQWLIMSHGIALAPALWLLGAPLLRGALDLSPQDAWLTAAFGGFAVIFLLAHALNVRGLGRAAAREPVLNSPLTV